MKASALGHLTSPNIPLWTMVPPGRANSTEQKRRPRPSAPDEIFRIARDDFVSVLRLPPRMIPRGRNETMLREYRVLEALNGTEVPHPEAKLRATTTAWSDRASIS
jgi:aminoglycoside phosphotransferase (APT) family kinase protein